MTLLELCEPLFQYVSRLNRSARKGGHHEYNHVRAEVKALFEEMESKSGGDVSLIPQYEKIEPALVFFVDSMIAESHLPFARDWNQNRLAYERKELAGDEKFFDLLEETLNDSSKAATERLAVFYTCIGLGFTGFYAGQPDYLRRKMLDCKSRIRDMMDMDEFARICPETYDHTDTRDFVEPPGKKLLAIAIALIGLILVLFVANLLLFKSASRELGRSLNKINSEADVGAKSNAGRY